MLKRPILAGVMFMAVTAAFAASAAERDWFQNFVNAHGGCPNLTTFLSEPYLWSIRDKVLNHKKLDEELFGKSILKWSDDDVTTALDAYRDCAAKIRSTRINLCLNGGFSRSQCEQKNPILPQEQNKLRTFEFSLRSTITGARDIDNQKKEEQVARIEAQKAEAENQRVRAEEEAQKKAQELREQAERDREAAEKARQSAEREEPKIAEATKEAEEAQRARREAEQKLAEIRNRIESQERARTQALAKSQEAETKSQKAEQEQRLLERGYQVLSVDSFVLDGKGLAEKAAKVALSGIYIREGGLDVLYVDQRAAMMAYGGVNQPKAALLIDDAPRELREQLLWCQSNPAASRVDCSLRVEGRATMCTISNAFGAKRESPCVSVEGGYATRSPR